MFIVVTNKPINQHVTNSTSIIYKALYAHHSLTAIEFILVFFLTVRRVYFYFYVNVFVVVFFFLPIIMAGVQTSHKIIVYEKSELNFC